MEQIGGTHYQSSFQPIDLIEELGLDFSEGNVVKYITRHEKKNGKQDLEKAAWYVKRLVSKPNKKRVPRLAEEKTLMTYLTINNINSQLRQCIELVYLQDYEAAQNVIELYLAQH